MVYLCEPGFEVPARGFKALSLNLTVRHIIATYITHDVELILTISFTHVGDVDTRYTKLHII